MCYCQQQLICGLAEGCPSVSKEITRFLISFLSARFNELFLFAAATAPGDTSGRGAGGEDEAR